ncbi:hypothetical protein COX86_03930 [Candidatus Micrarchaeota archaeon CG_4_10_14_0_2_um_filter_60_11]|nr:MAG: hypothetical protein COU39_01510 [Candidatus Micrarchaeota archaeon CG10_big_fil_rev_8_21_14_0_10_60_32]PIY91848.1 MAG: hypothetical protein COY71_00930 [Candidatus Micrarchaeota archaeon CG_4_10_14_0_8_um_filter_60_7]PIZ90626.1 MAG: hypothetical protein COX86_03930 [Candidatus Micrarchaeota archaeon CG_4_10_14_0_2_um_filter_60_11]
MLVLAVASLLAASSAYEWIGAFEAPKKAAVDAPFAVGFNATGTGYLEYPAIYAAQNGTWVAACLFPEERLNGSKVYSCNVSSPIAGNFSLRASIHTNVRANCTNVTYTPNPTDGCGDYKDRAVNIV